MILDGDDPVCVAVVDAIHGGDVEHLRRLLSEQPDLATATIGDPNSSDPKAMSRTLLHVVTDWPGHFPNGAATVTALVEAGPLHGSPHRDATSLGGEQRRRRAGRRAHRGGR